MNEACNFWGASATHDCWCCMFGWLPAWGAISGLWHPRFRSRGWHLICCSPSSCSPFHCRSDFRRSDLGCVSALSVHRSDCTGHENAASRRSAIRRMLDLSGGPHLRLLSPWQSVTFSGTSVLASGDHEARPPSHALCLCFCLASLLLLPFLSNACRQIFRCIFVWGV